MEITFELCCLKKHLHKARYEYLVIRQLSNPSRHRIHLLQENITLLQRYKEETEKRLLEIHEEYEELRLTEEMADQIIIQSRKLLEKMLSAYLNGTKHYLKKDNIECPAYLVFCLNHFFIYVILVLSHEYWLCRIFINKKMIETLH